MAIFCDKYPMSLIVHAPELFEGDHILDLTSLDSDYRKRSIAEMKRVIAVTKQLASHFLRLMAGQ